MSADKTEGKHLPKILVYQLYQRRILFIGFRNNYCYAQKIAYIGSCGHLIQMGQILQQIKDTGIHSTIARIIIVIFLVYRTHVIDHQRPVAVILRINGGELYIINNEQNQCKGHGQPRTRHINGGKEAILFHHGPCLFERCLYHN